MLSNARDPCQWTYYRNLEKKLDPKRDLALIGDRFIELV
jgi:hypothetical protein